MQAVFVFHGSGSRFANAVFSTRKTAEDWIARHSLTGLLTEYDLDSPAFDRRSSEGSLPKDIRKSLERGDAVATLVQQYVDGSVHTHYFYGVGETSPQFVDAMERWHRAHGEASA